jgi:8-oxo-(d)GTP phosphatase
VADGNHDDSPIRAAGTVLWRPGARGVEVALVHRPRYDDWSFPKGKLIPGEHPVTAAVRETVEETGYRAVLGRRLGSQRYLVNGRRKQVRYWAARADGVSVFEPNAEVDEVHWLPLGEARNRLTHDRDTDTLWDFAVQPVDTVPLILLRHARSVPRSTWAGEDDERPLAPEGRLQSGALADPLSRFGRPLVVSSPTRRCIDTIGPLAARQSWPVRLEPAFSEEAYKKEPGRAEQLTRAAVAARHPTVICTHRPLLPELYAAAVLDSALPAAGATLAVAEAHVLHAYDGRVIATEKLKPSW